MKLFCGSSRFHGGLVRSAGPNRNAPEPGADWSISKCVQSRSGFAAGPASRTRTSRPCAASSFAMTAPPPPAPMTITSRIDPPPVLEIADERIATVRDTVVRRQRPTDRLRNDRSRRGIEHADLRVREESDEARQDPEQRPELREGLVVLEHVEHNG